VPTGAQNVSLTAAGATTINVNGNYAVNNVDLGSNIASTSPQHPDGQRALSQGGSTIDLGTGTLELKGSFVKTPGPSPEHGNGPLSGAAAQNIAAGVTYYNLIFRNGGAVSPRSSLLPVRTP